MGTGASVPSSSSHGGDVLDESQAQRLAGPIWHQATFNQYAKDHELESGGVVRGIKRNEYMAVVWDAMAGNLGIDQRKGPFWERVHRLYLFMDGALGGTDGKVTLEELKVRESQQRAFALALEASSLLPIFRFLVFGF